MYVPKLTSANRGGGTISATSLSAGTTGRREVSAIGEPDTGAAAIGSFAVAEWEAAGTSVEGTPAPYAVRTTRGPGRSTARGGRLGSCNS
ncbi:hypothetical protein GCM10010519_41630 [Streptomyces lactacystinicus]